MCKMNAALNIRPSVAPITSDGQRNQAGITVPVRIAEAANEPAYLCKTEGCVHVTPAGAERLQVVKTTHKPFW